MTEQVDDIPIDPNSELVAEPAPGYRWKHMILAVGLIVFGLWFAYDGWIRWPNENRRAEQVQRDKDKAQEEHDDAKVQELAKELEQLSRHSGTDLLIQKLLAFILPAGGIAWGIWTLRETRGVYRMTGGTLAVPGHPPITYDDIRRIDKRKWDRKGVAFVHYETGIPPQPGILKLDDFAYDRRATDAILERIERNVVPSTAPAPSPAARTSA